MSCNPKSLVGHCGLYCGACGIYQGKIRQAVENLQKIIATYGFDKIMPELSKWEPSFQHYSEFDQVMNGLVKIFGECPACVAGGGDPSCAIRECCKQKAYATCLDCAEMEKCEKLQQYPWASERLKEIRFMGFDKWVEEMQKKVDSGYCYLDEKK